MKSEFVEGDNVDRLDVVLKSFNPLLHNIRGDLVILHSCPDDDLENAIGDWLLLPLGLPVETVHLDSENLVGKGLEVGILTPWLDFPDDEGFGNRRWLLALLGCSSLCLNSISSGSISFRILRKWIEIVLCSSCCRWLLPFASLFVVVLTSFSTFLTLLHETHSRVRKSRVIMA